jgi:hypothetical protein
MFERVKAFRALDGAATVIGFSKINFGITVTSLILPSGFPNNTLYTPLVDLIVLYVRFLPTFWY